MEKKIQESKKVLLNEKVFNTWIKYNLIYPQTGWLIASAIVKELLDNNMEEPLARFMNSELSKRQLLKLLEITNDNHKRRGLRSVKSEDIEYLFSAFQRSVESSYIKVMDEMSRSSKLLNSDENRMEYCKKHTKMFFDFLIEAVNKKEFLALAKTRTEEIAYIRRNGIDPTAKSIENDANIHKYLQENLAAFVQKNELDFLPYAASLRKVQ
jgi:hypothetical protein